MRLIVAFQGETGAFSEAAAREHLGDAITLLPCRTFDDAVRAVVDGHADRGVLPVHNVIVGDVHEARAAMARVASIEHVGEITFPIRLALLGLAGAAVDDIREVLSHGIALQQCARFLGDHPAIRTVEAHDTAGAARMVAIRRDPSVGAIAATWAATHYGLAVLAEGVEDRPDNATTFTVIRRNAACVRRAPGDARA